MPCHCQYIFPQQNSVRVSSLPSLPAGTNNIGSVNVNSLPTVSLSSLPEGTNNIGSVDIQSTGPLSDAFGRLRVSEPFNLFSSKTLRDSRPLLWSEAITGSGTSNFLTNQSAVSISVGSSSGSVIRQSKRYSNYQPGKSQLIFISFVMRTPEVGVTKRVGYFDNTCGIYLEATSSGISFVLKTVRVDGTAVYTSVSQSDWTINTFQGLNLNFPQILCFDFEWLGVGRVRAGFVVDGEIFYCHEFLNSNQSANTRDNIGVFINTPNLPIRYEISSIGNLSDTMTCICSSVQSEGGQQYVGYLRAINTGTTAITVSSPNTVLLGISLKPTYYFSTIKIKSISILCNTSSSYQWNLVLNPSLSGPVSWLDLTNSSARYAIGTGTLTATNGTILYSEYSLQGNNTSSSNVFASSNTENNIILGTDVNNNPDQLFILITRLQTTGSDDFYCSINFEEQY